MEKKELIFKIIIESIKDPKTLKNIIQEMKQSRDDKKHSSHKYNYNYFSIEEFFENVYPDINIKQYEKELNEIENIVKEFFKKMECKEYPSYEKPYPLDYSINSDSRKFLYILCRTLQPETIVETGIAYGISSLYILKALEKNSFGRLYSIDSVFRPWQSEKMIGAILPINLRGRWNLVLGKSSEKLKDIVLQLGVIDIFIHDSLHTYKNMLYEFDTVIGNIKNQGIIVSDDVLGNDAFFEFTKKSGLKNYLIKVEEGVGLGIIENKKTTPK